MSKGVRPYDAPFGGAVRIAQVVLPLCVMLLAAGLRKTTADHVADRDDGHIEPRLGRREAITMSARRLDHRSRDENPGHNCKEGDEFGRLERSLGFRRDPTDRLVRGSRAVVGTAVGPAAPGGACGTHTYSYRKREK